MITTNNIININNDNDSDECPYADADWCPQHGRHRPRPANKLAPEHGEMAAYAATEDLAYRRWLARPVWD